MGLTWFMFLITAILVFLGVIILIWKNVTGERTERTIILKILINYMQTLSFVGGIVFKNLLNPIFILMKISVRLHLDFLENRDRIVPSFECHELFHQHFHRLLCCAMVCSSEVPVLHDCSGPWSSNHLLVFLLQAYLILNWCTQSNSRLIRRYNNNQRKRAGIFQLNGICSC